MTRERVQAFIGDKLTRSGYKPVDPRITSPASSLDQYFFDGRTVYAITTLDPFDHYIGGGNGALTEYARELGEKGICFVPVFDRSFLPPRLAIAFDLPNLVTHVLSWTSNPDKVPLTLVKLEERDAYFDTFSFRPTGQRFKANMAERIKFHYFHGCKPLGSTRSGILLGTFTNNYDTEMEFDNPQERADKVLGHTTPEVVQEEYIPPTHTMQELFDDGKLDDFTEEVDK